MRFNSIVIVVPTFLLFFTSVTNALPMDSTSSAQPADPFMDRVSLGTMFIDRNGFQVFRATLHGTIDPIIVEKFSKKSPWTAMYTSEYDKWSKAASIYRSQNMEPILHSNRDGDKDVALIVLRTSVPEANLEHIIRSCFNRLKRDRMYQFDNKEWAALEKYANANPQELRWQRRRGWYATPIFNLNYMLLEAKSLMYNQQDLEAAHAMVDLSRGHNP